MQLNGQATLRSLTRAQSESRAECRLSGGLVVPGFTLTERRAGFPLTGDGTVRERVPLAGSTPRVCDSSARVGRSSAVTHAVLTCAERAGLTPKRPASGHGRQAQSCAHSRDGLSCLPLIIRPSSVHPSVHPSIIRPSVSPYTHPLSIYPPVLLVSHQCTHPNCHPPICASICLSICSSIHPCTIPTSFRPSNVCWAISVHCETYNV